MPQIALGEFVYTALRGKVDDALSNATVQETVQQLLGSSFILVERFPESGWEILMSLKIPELHERMLAAESLARGLPIVSNDTAFDDVSGLSVVWD